MYICFFFFSQIRYPKDQPQAVPKPSSIFYKLRREKFVSILLEHFCEVEGPELSQQVVLETLQSDHSQKTLATNAMNDALPKCLVSWKRTGKERVTIYKNVARKHSFTLSLEEPSVSLEETSEISN